MIKIHFFISNNLSSKLNIINDETKRIMTGANILFIKHTSTSKDNAKLDIKKFNK
jgi:hypothetical protein